MKELIQLTEEQSKQLAKAKEDIKTTPAMTGPEAAKKLLGIELLENQERRSK